MLTWISSHKVYDGDGIFLPFTEKKNDNSGIMLTLIFLDTEQICKFVRQLMLNGR